MIDSTLQSKIKHIKIQTNRILNNTLSGDYLSAFKGTGLEFDQIREYTIGDDIRTIDWNSSAKMHKTMVKQFVQERDRTIILAIDVSQSTFFGSQPELKKQIIENIAGTIALIANHSKDHVGALFFSDVIERWIPPSKGNLHLGSILKTIFTMQPRNTKTNLVAALQFLIGLKKRNAVVFMVSDFIDNNNDCRKLLKVAAREYDFVGIRILDPVEQTFPDIGLIELEDIENGTTILINTRNKNVAHVLHKRCDEQKKMFDAYTLDLLDIGTTQPFIPQLAKFFHNRIRRRM